MMFLIRNNIQMALTLAILPVDSITPIPLSAPLTRHATCVVDTLQACPGKPVTAIRIAGINVIIAFTGFTVIANTKRITIITRGTHVTQWARITRETRTGSGVAVLTDVTCQGKAER